MEWVGVESIEMFVLNGMFVLECDGMGCNGMGWNVCDGMELT
jgi:glycyl-tRNA synthetase alpha subunit